MADAIEALWHELQHVIDSTLQQHEAASLFAECDVLHERHVRNPAVAPATQPVVREWLATAVANAPEPWRRLAERVAAATPELPWIRSYENLESSDALEAFRAFYSYQVLAGPVFRGRAAAIAVDDVLIGFSLQAPNVFYPAHHHEPPEIYGVISGALEWQVGDTWSTVGPGDVIVHRSHESHAMRTLDEPALTWVMWPRNPHADVYMPSLDPPDKTMAPITY